MKNQKGFTHWVIVILISIIAVGLVSAAWYYEANKEEATTSTGTTSETNTNTASNTNANTAASTNTNVMVNINTVVDGEIFESIGIVRECQWTMAEYCKEKCYSIITDRGEEIVDWSKVGDRAEYIDKSVS